MSLDPETDILFVGMGASAVCYYRIMLPAMTLKADWTGIVGSPPGHRWVTGLIKKDSQLPEFEQYKVIVVQQPCDPAWHAEIDRLRAKGVKVLFEVDDYLHGIPKVKSHDFRKHFDARHLAFAEVGMKKCDGIICSTDFIAKRYKRFGRTFVCENGLDLQRYDLQKPKRDTTNIGWAGATGHAEAMMPWMQQVVAAMRMRDNTNFVSVGQAYAQIVKQSLTDERGIIVPWAAVEQYPSAMTMIDIALAPAGHGSFFRGKSDLRWLEAGALGIPIIADSIVYPKVTDGVDGIKVNNPQEMATHLIRLIDDPELRTQIGDGARSYVRENRDIQKMADNWLQVCEAVVD